MAFLARDTQHQTGFAVTVKWGRYPLERSAVTFQASRHDGLIEMRRAVGIAGAINPAM